MIGHTPHDYLQPMYLLSGLLWRLGLSIQIAYLVWKPVALLVLFVGFRVYIRRLLPENRGGQVAALAIALFYESPLLAFATWAGHLSAGNRLALVFATDDAYSALNLWGFEHTAIAIGLMPVFLLAAAKLLAIQRERSRLDRRWTAVAAVAGLLVSWLHPWQGAILLGIVAGSWALRASRRPHLALAVPVAATVLPLVYGVALARADPSWRAFQAHLVHTGTAPWWALLASFGLLVALAAVGIRRPRQDSEWMLLLWPASCVAIYFGVPQFPSHALAGVTLPLAVLTVRGWRRVRAWSGVGTGAAAAIAVAAILVSTVPSAVLHAQGVRDAGSHSVAGALEMAQYRLTTDQAAALAYLDRARRPGGVLAPWLLSLSVPAFTGRAVYVGHLAWEPRANLARDDLFFSPAARDPGGSLRRTILTRSGAAFVLADCGAPVSLGRDIALVARAVRRFGCVPVYATS